MEVSTKESEEKPNSPRLCRLIGQPGKQNLKKEKIVHISFFSKKAIASVLIATVLAVVWTLGVSATSYVQTWPGPTGYGSTSGPQHGAQAGYTPTAFSGSANLRVSGSTTVYPIVHEFTTTYASDLPGVTADVQQGGSGWGRDDTGIGWGDVAMSSSAFPTSGNQGVQPDTTTPMWDVTKIARDAICVIINSDVTGITHLTKAQIKSIYEDTSITSWKQITDPVTSTIGNDIPIKIFARELGSGTRSSIGDQCSFHKDSNQEYDLEIAKVTAVMGASWNRPTSNEAMQADINTNDGSANGGIGYVGLGFSVNSDGTPLANATEIQIVSSGTTAYSPTTLNVYTGLYPLARFLQVGVLHGYQSPNAANATTLITGLTGEDGQKCVADQHFLKLFMDQDVNKNGKVNSTDVGAVGSAFNSVPTDPNWNVRADVNRSGKVNSTDVGSIGLYWNYDYSANMP
jgi:ABC-type phosphate transport system substrate-binding protein